MTSTLLTAALYVLILAAVIYCVANGCVMLRKLLCRIGLHTWTWDEGKVKTIETSGLYMWADRPPTVLRRYADLTCRHCGFKSQGFTD